MVQNRYHLWFAPGKTESLVKTQRRRENGVKSLVVSAFLRGVPVAGFLAVFLLWTTLCIGGCAGPRQAAAPPTTAAREEFDPQTLGDDDFLLQPPSRAVSARPGARPRLSPTDVSAGSDGYRVQISAVLDRTRAEALVAEAEERLKALAYIHHERDTRLYKIQVGNCRTAEDAERLRQEAKDQGYGEAFVVRSRIEQVPVQHRQTTVPGYRVQIFSASNQQDTKQAQARARNLLGRDDIYVVFEPPFYKVRVGNFRTQEEAVKFIRVIKQYGYNTSFPVQTQVLELPE